MSRNGRKRFLPFIDTFGSMPFLLPFLDTFGFRNKRKGEKRNVEVGPQRNTHLKNPKMQTG